MCLSLEERIVELITITGNSHKCDEREETIPNLFPDPYFLDEKNRSRFDMDRPYKFQKPCVFLSARVHPGEV